MPRRSAGILLYRSRPDGPEVLLVHPGGPFWAKKDLGAWSIPKGEVEAEEEPSVAALREFAEETGTSLTGAHLLELGQVRQKGGKIVLAFAAERDLDPASIRSNIVEIVWPPRSGRTLLIPEIDRAEWYSLEAARERILASQAVFLDRLHERLTQT